MLIDVIGDMSLSLLPRVIWRRWQSSTRMTWRRGSSWLRSSSRQIFRELCLPTARPPAFCRRRSKLMFPQRSSTTWGLFISDWATLERPRWVCVCAGFWVARQWYLNHEVDVLCCRNTSLHLSNGPKLKGNTMSITTMPFLSPLHTIWPACTKQCANSMKLRNSTKTSWENIQTTWTVRMIYFTL